MSCHLGVEFTLVPGRRARDNQAGLLNEFINNNRKAVNTYNGYKNTKHNRKEMLHLDLSKSL